MERKKTRKAHGCLQALAVLGIILFIIVAVPTALLTRFAGLLTNRAHIKSSIALEDTVKTFLVQAIYEDIQLSYAEQGLQPAEINTRQLYMAMDLLIPPGWIDDALAGGIDAVYELLEHGRTEAYTLNTAPVAEALESRDGFEAITLIISNYPPCGNGSIPENATQTLAISCLPPDIPLEQTAVEIHTAVINDLRNDSSIAQLSWPPEILEATVEIREVYRVLNQMWQLWLIPLALLALIALLAVRSLPGLGLWLGWPLLFSGILTSIAGFAVFFLYISMQQSLLAQMGPIEDQMGQLLMQLILGVFNSLRNIWFGNVLVTSAVMFILGLGGILSAFFYNRRMRKIG